MITLHPAKADDFSTLGYGALLPTECKVEEQAGGMYQLTMTHPMDEDGRWWNLQKYNIIKAPAPVREVPRLVIDGQTEQGATITRRIYKVSTPQGGRLRLRKRASTSSKVISKYKPGTKVVQLSTSGSWSKVAVCKGGATGWMWTAYLQYVETKTESAPKADAPDRVIEPRQVRDQLFRISKVETDDAAGLVRVTALHIAYDLAGNAIKGGLELENVAANTAVTQILAKANDEHPFEIFCGVTGTVSGDFTGKSVAAALWGDEGIVEQTGARLVRDNFDIFILPDEERDLGVEIRHGKNLTGAIAYEDVSGILTRIIPVGKDKKGNRIGLDAPGYVESPRAANIPVIRSQEIEYDVQIGQDGISNATQAKAKLKELAEADFANGADGSVVGLDVDFVQLENTREYAEYADLQTVHLYDTVHVVSGKSGIRAGVRMTGYIYDVAGDVPRYEDVTLGEITDMETTVYGYDIVSGSTPGTKLINGTVTGEKIRNATIDYAKIAQAAVEQLCADSITAVRAHINELVTGSLTTDQLYADLAVIAAAQITAANIEKANIDWASIATLTTQIATIAKAQITTANIKDANIQWAEIADLTAKMAEIADAKIDDAEITTAQIKDLEATLADIVTAKIGTADIGFAQIKDLTAGTAIITEGVSGELYISRLAVTEANIVSLSVGQLIVKGEDGNFYAVSVDENGDVQTTLKQIGNADVKDLSINAGEKLIEGSITAACLNAEDIFADNAIIRQLIAANMDVGTLFANDAFISHLNTTDISGNEYLKLSVSNAVNSIDFGGRNLLTKTREFTPTSAAGTKIDDTYRDLAVRYLDCTALESGYQDLAQWSNVVYPEYGERYALSFYAKGSGNIETYFNGGTDCVKVKIVADSSSVRPSGDAALYVDSNGDATISALTVDADGNATLTVDSDGNATINAETYGDGKCVFELSEGWTRYWVTYECASTGTKTVGKNVVFRVNHGDKAYVCGAKLEKGSVATDWSPAPEDAEGEISSLKTRVSAAELKITPDAIAATVKENIEFGGRNLVLDSAVEKSSTKTSDESQMFPYWTLSDYGQTALGESGTEFTISFEAKASVDGAAFYACLRKASDSALFSSEGAAFNLSTSYQRYNAALKTYATETARFWPAMRANVASGTTYWVRNVKVEKGNVATDWSPAPEDAEGEIDALDTRVSEAELKITPTAIVSTVTSSETYKALSNTVDTAKSTANTAKSTAETAQSTANSAKSKADENESDIAALETRVSEAEVRITPDAIAATVKEKIELGGRNYILNSRETFEAQGAETELATVKIGDTASKETALSLFGETVTVSFDWEHTVTAGTATLMFNYKFNGVKAFTADVAATGHYENTFQLEAIDTPPDWANANVLYVYGTFTGTVKIRNLKLEKGNKATDWSPAPEDAADSVYVDSSYSKVEINKDRVRIVSTQMEVAVPSADGEDDVMRVDKDGVHAEVVETDMVLSDSVVSTQSAAYYTPTDAGALAEILEELSGKHLTGETFIDCQNITSGSFELRNLSGPGSVQCIRGGTMNGLTIAHCTCAIYVSGMTFSTGGTGAVIENSERVYFTNCVFNADVGVQLGVGWGARARMEACTGTCTKLATLTYNSELDLLGSSKPTGTLEVQGGSQVYNATSDPNFTAPSSGSVPTTQVATVSLSPTSTSTSGHSGLGSKLYQGRYSSSQSFRKGVMLFTLPSDLTSAENIESATLTIKRIAGVGGGGSVVAQIRCYDEPGTLYASKSVQNGQTVSIDVTSAVKAMKANNKTGLMLYNPDTTLVGSKSYTTGYARFAGKGESGAPVLKVTYKK